MEGGFAGTWLSAEGGYVFGSGREAWRQEKSDLVRARQEMPPSSLSEHLRTELRLAPGRSGVPNSVTAQRPTGNINCLCLDSLSLFCLNSWFLNVSLAPSVPPVLPQF